MYGMPVPRDPEQYDGAHLWGPAGAAAACCAARALRPPLPCGCGDATVLGSHRRTEELLCAAPPDCDGECPARGAARQVSMALLAALLLATAVQPATTAAGSLLLTEQLSALAELHQAGSLTPAEFLAAKVAVLAPQATSAAVPPAAGRPVFSVLAYGARGDNNTDDTLAFRAALRAASAARGGQVFIPPGLYVLAGNLTVPPGVTLQGTYSAPPSHDLQNPAHKMGALLDGSVLVPTGQRGSIGCAPGVDDLDCTAAFITIAGDAAVQGLVVYYAEQETVQWPVPYPWTFRLGGPAPAGPPPYEWRPENAALKDVELLGSWNGVAAVKAGRHYIARVQGQPLNIGVFVDEIYDIGRIEDVHFVPWFSQAAPLIYHQTMHGRAFIFARSDWQYVLNTFCYGYSVGYLFVDRGSGGMNGNFLGIGADASTNASVFVQKAHPYGILITNAEFTAFCDQGLVNSGHPVRFCEPSDPKVAPVHLKVLPSNQGAVKFVGSSFWGPSHAVTTTAGTGTVSFIGCHFENWDNQLNATANGFVHNGTAAVQQFGGTLIISNSEFKGQPAAIGGAGSPWVHLKLFAGARKTVMTGNIIAGKLLIEKDPQHVGKLASSDNLDDS
jgi:hypothetical protein